MSFGIWVSFKVEFPPRPDDFATLDDWLIECNKYVLYDEPLGGDGNVYYYWSGPANTLRLPKIAGIYNQGLHLETVEELSQFTAELDQLEKYWQSQAFEEPLREHLRERMGYVREAVRIAQNTPNTVLSIS